MANGPSRASLRGITKVTPAVLSAMLIAAGASFAVQDQPVGSDADVAQTPAVQSPSTDAMPTISLRRPASVSKPDRKALHPSARPAASMAGIPDAALAAYQRAASVLNVSDSTCKLDWSVVAAIGEVESDHGRFSGSRLSAKGLATPAIYGIPLNGKLGTRKIHDTDAGRLDDDRRWDRAVGPMQFIPATWSAVGVDADGDGRRDPQDIDDAALAAGVYLCSGDEDLSTPSGLESAIHRYNRSSAYVALVISLAKGFTQASNDIDVTTTDVSTRQLDEVDEVVTRQVPVTAAGRGGNPLRADAGRAGEAGVSGTDADDKGPRATYGEAKDKPGRDQAAGEHPTGPTPPTNQPGDGSGGPSTEEPGTDPTTPSTEGPGEESTETPADGSTETPSEGSTDPAPEPTEEETTESLPVFLTIDQIAAYDPAVVEAARTAIATAGFVDNPALLNDEYDLALSTYLTEGELPMDMVPSTPGVAAPPVS